MKKVNVLITLVVCVLFSASFAVAGPIVIKIGDSTPPTYSYAPAFEIFEKEVEKASNGAIDVQYFGSAVLGNQKTLVESTRMGAIQMCVVPSTVSQNNIPQHRLFTLPMLWPDYKTLRAWLDSPEGQAIGNLWETQGAKFLGWGHIGWIGIQNSKHEIKRAADMEGMKIRTMPDSVLVDTQNALGAMGVAMGIGELYSAVQQGVLDGISTSPQFLYSLKIYEVAKYYTHVKLHTAPALVLMNLSFWQKLSPEHQKIITAAAKNWEKNNDAYYLDDSLKTSDNNILKLFTELGVQNHVPTVDESAEFRKMTKPVFEKYRKDVGEDLVDQVVNFVGYK